MVDRLVEKMAPAVHEIARRSLAPTELVLKRLLDNGRREEIFLARRELEQKFEGLADRGRTILATLGLSDGPLVVAPTPPPAAVVAPTPTPPEPPPAVAAADPVVPPDAERAVTAPVAASAPPPAPASAIRTNESQRPGPVAPRPGSLAPPRPSSRPTPAAAPSTREDALGSGKPQ